MTVKIQVEVFWVVTPCSVVVGHQRFAGPCCVRLHPVDRKSHPKGTTRNGGF